MVLYPLKTTKELSEGEISTLFYIYNNLKTNIVYFQVFNTLLFLLSKNLLHWKMHLLCIFMLYYVYCM